jgi:hypothetical protein
MKTIPLTQGKIAIVDDCEFERLNRFKWWAIRTRAKWYAVREQNRKRMWMHREILGTNAESDHINGDGLDNRRINLRSCSHAQNCRNRRTFSSKSGFKGVYKSRNKWIAQLQPFRNRKYLGTFPTKEEAAIAYNQAAKETYGDFALLNEVKN